MLGRFIAVALALSATAPAVAQTAAPAAAKDPPPSPPATRAAELNIDMPVGQIEADPRGRVVIARNLPRLTSHPAYDQVKTMSLRDIAPLSGGAITDELLAKIASELAAAGK